MFKDSRELDSGELVRIVGSWCGKKSQKNFGNQVNLYKRKKSKRKGDICEK